MASTAVTVQSKTMELKAYLEKPEVKGKLESALPKWLSVERLLRVIHSSVMKNPKLADCSTVSILQSAMDCAQLGLEPILGRAYLIPYQNSKNIGGQWTKVYECQMQIGYQGLIDLARRSNTIADVWGAVVYENDDFRLSFGMERELHHVPWYMNPEKRQEGKPGEIIGAYVVWQLKDGTKHPDFMPIYDIYKRRERSQAYQWAELGDKSKGGGKQDSVWHVWPDEMILKTVVKHSAKMVPASIEFMQAVEADDEPVNGHGMLFGGGGFALPEPGSEVDAEWKTFDELIADKVVPNDGSLDRFLKETARAQRIGLEDLKVAAAEDFDSFWSAYEEWQKKQKPIPLAEAIAKARPAAGKKAAQDFIDLITQNRANIGTLPDPVKNQARAKWDNAGLGPWPLDEQPQEPQANNAPPGSSSEPTLECHREQASIGITECESTDCPDRKLCDSYRAFKAMG